MTTTINNTENRSGTGKTSMPNRRTCGTMDLHRELLEESNRYARNRDEIKIITSEFISGERRTERGVIKIPVVVHVVWNKEEQNISDAQIRSQIDVLNRDFRKANPDITKVPPPWTDLAADSRIEFYLAEKDPNGNPTTGINRTHTTKTEFRRTEFTSNGLIQPVKSKATGGADPWPADRYLNIWVCQLGGGLLGYAQFPGVLLKQMVLSSYIQFLVLLERLKYQAVEILTT